MTDSSRVKDNLELRGKIEKLLALCKEMGISISHQDYQGRFVVEQWSEHNAGWLRNASNRTDEPPECP